MDKLIMFTVAIIIINSLTVHLTEVTEHVTDDNDDGKKKRLRKGKKIFDDEQYS